MQKCHLQIYMCIYIYIYREREREIDDMYINRRCGTWTRTAGGRRGRRRGSWPSRSTSARAGSPS